MSSKPIKKEAANGAGKAQKNEGRFFSAENSVIVVFELRFFGAKKYG
jgi:hypothetical protein